MEKFKSMASLIGEPTRASMLWYLLDGKAYTATELSIYADVSSQNASMHLSKLVQAELLIVEKQGRHKYYRFARPEIAYAIEAMANLIPAREALQPTVTVNEGIKFCRTCYDHLAGKVAVEITNKLVINKIIVPNERLYNVTTKGEEWFKTINVSIKEVSRSKRIFARQCIDWTERKHHIGGALGAALFQAMVNLKWIKKNKDSRLTQLTNEGRIGLNERLNLLI